VLHSDWPCTVLDDQTVRLGLCVVRGLRREHGARIVLERLRAPFTSVNDFRARTGLNKVEQRGLAKIGALAELSTHRRDALWRVESPLESGGLFAAQAEASAPAPLPPMNVWQRLAADYDGMSLSVGPHPMRLLRGKVPNAWRACDLPQAPNGAYLQIAGQVICRQRPGTAKGFVFVSLEDETGVANAILLPDFFEKHRLLVTSEEFLLIEGRLQNLENVIHVKAVKVVPFDAISLNTAESHDFR
jgi:error-prone DNA polymerase